MTLVTPVADEQIARWRRDTPGCARRLHLNNAGCAVPPESVTGATVAHLQREAEIGGYEAADEAAPRVAEAYGHVARLLGCAPRNVAVVDNATVAVSQALSAFDFAPGDALVTTRSDYTSNQLMYLALARRRGVEVLWAEELPAGGVDPGSVRELVRHPRCRLVSLTWIPTNSGLVQRAEEVGEVCAEAGIPYVVDACQAVGQMPVDPTRLRCDYLAATARKFLRGPRGIGFLYVSDRALDRGDHPLAIDMGGALLTGPGRFELVDGAHRFENWEFAYALVMGLGEAVRYALEAGVEGCGQRAAELAVHARERLAAVPGVRVADRGERLCAIVTAQIAGWAAPDAVRRLRAAGVNTSSATMGYGPLNAPGTGAPTAVRLSPHYYNTHDEVDAAVAAIAELAREGARV
ncbi:MAG TPA: aminotransferase class V-fold PLP-dependent enzyme [Thermoanaerobaculia bacterium]|nr:aminotransferase class V-fold PLP-dependent enzyme [Thermoanaerobaculia bacterium]